jgi:heterodisulfide reductase subunit D
MQLDIKQIKETNAFMCLECGKCSGICPVSRYSHNYSPRQVLIRSIRNSHPDAIKGVDLWSCLTCQQCEIVCPADINYSKLTKLVRQGVGYENFEGTCSHGGVLQSISKIMTTPDLKQNRLGWLTKELQTSSDSEYLYFVGCLPYFEVMFEEVGANPLNIAKSTIKLLNYLGIKPQLLENEKCCGHDFFWNGEMETFRKLGESNIEMIRNSGAKTIVTSCPECYRTLKIDYPELFGKSEYQVIHISELISQRLKDLQLKLKDKHHRFTFQDPCRLGRHLGIYDAPREVLTKIEGSEFQEMAHHHHRAICCGVSGWINCSQISKQIQTTRLREAQATGADTLVTACAKCQIHFRCAMLDKQLKEELNIEIKDLTEVVVENL